MLPIVLGVALLSQVVFAEEKAQLFLRPTALTSPLRLGTIPAGKSSFLQRDFSWLEEDIRIDTLPYVHSFFHYLGVRKPELGELGVSGEMYVAWMTRPVTMPTFDVWTEGVYEFRNGRESEREVSQFWIQPSRARWFRIGTQIDLDGSYFFGFFIKTPAH